MKLAVLRWLLVLDSAVLFLLGALFIFLPGLGEKLFQFQDLPVAVHFLIGMWGCVFLTMGMGYVIAATDPARHAIWVQVGVARGALECVLGAVYLARGIVTFQQAGAGIIVAGLMATAYVVLYPRQKTISVS